MSIKKLEAKAKKLNKELKSKEKDFAKNEKEVIKLQKKIDLMEDKLDRIANKIQGLTSKRNETNKKIQEEKAKVEEKQKLADSGDFAKPLPKNKTKNKAVKRSSIEPHDRLHLEDKVKQEKTKQKIEKLLDKNRKLAEVINTHVGTPEQKKEYLKNLKQIAKHQGLI